MRQKTTLISLATISLLISSAMQTTFAAGNKSTAANSTLNSQAFELVPMFDIRGYTGHQNIGEGESLVPLFGDSGQVLYLDAEGKIGKSNNGWMAGLGGGYRKVISDMILGGYLMVDYSASPTNKKFLVANPGLEALGKAWDFRTNFYIPVGKDNWDARNQRRDFADKLGDNEFVRFTGHTEFDRFAVSEVNLREEASFGLGVDAEIGRSIPIVDDFKAYVGGYHFNTKDNGDINGASGRITYQVNNYVGIEAIDTYDKCRRNTAMIGIKLSLGGLGKDAQKRFGISGRLVDPIEHNIATIAEGYAVPIRTKTTSKIISLGTKDVIEHDNIWFFKPTAATDRNTSPQNADAVQGEGTYENPFIGFTQDNYAAIRPNIGTIDPFPLMYFAPGTYSLQGVGFPTDGRFSLPNGWGMFGRTSNYVAPAVLSDRAQFLGGIDLMYASGAGTEETTLDSIVIANQLSGINNAALFIQNAADVILQNLDIQNIATLNNLATYGIYADNSLLYMNGSSVSATSNPSTGTSLAYAINLINNSKLVLGNANNINATAISEISSSSSDATAYGINIDNSTLNINGNNNSITSEATAGDAETPGVVEQSSDALAFALYANNNSNVYLGGDYNNFITTAKAGTATASVTTNVTATATALAEGVSLQNDSSMNIAGNYNSFTTLATGGVAAANAGVEFLQSSTARAFAYGEADAFVLTNASTLSISGNHNNVYATAEGGTTNSSTASPFGSSSVSDAHADANGFILDSSSLNINGNNNLVETIALNSTAVATSQGSPFASAVATSNVNATAEDFNLVNSSMNILGSNNEILAAATGGSAMATSSDAQTTNANTTAIAVAAGFNLYSSSANIEGNSNSILINASGGTTMSSGFGGDGANTSSTSDAIADGFILMNYSSLNISGNFNSMNVIATAGTASSSGSGSAFVPGIDNANANATAQGFDLDNSTMSITGNGNSIAATAAGGNATSFADGIASSSNANAAAIADGFFLNNDSSLNLSGNSTAINATATGGSASASGATESTNAIGFAAGLSLNGSSSTVSGSGTIITATADGGLENGSAADGLAYGAYLTNNSTLDFKSTATNTQIIVNGSTVSTGIFADALSHLQRDGSDITTFSELTDLITFTKTSASGGYKIDWGSNKLNW